MRSLLPLLLFPLLTGCQVNYTILEHHDVNLPAGDKPTVVLEMANGPIKISTGPGKALVGKLTKRGVGIDKEEAERELALIDFDLKPEADGKIHIRAVRTDKRGWHSSGAEAELQVPAGTILELVTTNSPVNVEGPAGNVLVKTSNGCVTLTGSACPVVVTTSNGSVTAADVAGTVKIDTTNGNISVKGRQLNLACTTSNGRIRFAGDVTAGEHRLSSRNGSIEVTLPRDVCLNVEAATSNGKVSSDFTLARTGFGYKKSKTQIKGTIGDEETDRTLVLKTSNSSISLKRGKSKDLPDIAAE